MVAGALYFGRDILLPFAFAALLSFLLAPLGEPLEIWKVAGIPSVFVLVSAAFILFAGLAFVLGLSCLSRKWNSP